MWHEWVIIGLVAFSGLQLAWDLFNQMVALIVFFTKYHDMNDEEIEVFSNRCYRMRIMIAVWIGICLIGTTIMMRYV